MKKMFFGSLLFFGGIIGIITFTVLSVIHPWDYNDITGLRGFLLGSKTMWIFILASVMSVIGIIICFYEAYIRKSA